MMRTIKKKAPPVLNKARFAPCAKGTGLLITLGAAARLARPGGTVSISPVGAGFSDDFKPVPMNRNNLTSRGICRGKISQRNNQNHLEERTPTAPKQ
jgi:threonine dehydrogenase-like Zn-dependent dehydrogenase